MRAYRFFAVARQSITFMYLKLSFCFERRVISNALGHRGAVQRESACSHWSMIEIVKEPEWLPTTCVDHRFTTHPLTETTSTFGVRRKKKYVNGKLLRPSVGKM